MGAELFLAEKLHRANLTFALRNFAKAPEKGITRPVDKTASCNSASYWPQSSFFPEVSRRFHQSLQVNSKVVSQCGHNCFLPDPFQFTSLYNNDPYIREVTTRRVTILMRPLRFTGAASSVATVRLTASHTANAKCSLAGHTRCII